MTQRDLVLVWIAKFGFTTSVIVSELLGISERAREKGQTDTGKKARELLALWSSGQKIKKAKDEGEKDKILSRTQYLKRVETLGNQGQRLYMLTEEGLAQATYALAMDYNYDFKPSSIDHTRLLHSLGVQFICASLFRKIANNDISNIMPERLIKYPKGIKQADAVISTNNGDLGIEFERSEKAGDRLDRFFQEIENAIDSGYYTRFAVYSEIDGIIKRYKEHAQTSFTRWEMREKRWVAKAKKPLTETTKKNIKLLSLVAIGKAIRPITYGQEKRRSKSIELAVNS